MTTTRYSLLLALSLKPRHGYQLMEQVSQDSKGAQQIGAGTLYAEIKSLLMENLIDEIPNFDNKRRREYRLTKRGWDSLRTETKAYSRRVKLAKNRGVI